MISYYHIYKAPIMLMNWDLILKILKFIFEVVKFVKKLYDEKHNKNKNNRKA